MQEPQEEDLYDEFGNYIGPDLDSSDDDSSSDDSDNQTDNDNDNDDTSQNSAVSDLPMTIHDPTSTSTPSNETAPSSNQIVLHEDKVHYPSAQTLYGPSVTTAVLDEDVMDIDTPLVRPLHRSALPKHDITPSAIKKRNEERDALHHVSESYLTDALLANTATTETRRGVALVGNLNSGKTSLLDLLYRTTLVSPPPDDVDGTDPHGYDRSPNDLTAGGTGHISTSPSSATVLSPSEASRRLTLSSAPVTLPLRSTRGKTYALTLIDTPGHIQFHDEAAISLRSADGVVLVLDCIEGPTLSDELLIRQTVQEGLPLSLVLNKTDRLIVELKLPLEDAYCKLRHCIEEVNRLVEEVGGGRYPPLCPGRGNVAFASAEHGWCFTLGSWAELCVDHVDSVHNTDGSDDDDGGYEDEDEDDEYGMGDDDGYVRFGRGILGKNLPPSELAKRLWGDVYLCPTTRTFQRSRTACRPSNKNQHLNPITRTFTKFVLEPIYKLYAACLGEPEKDVARVLRSIGVHLTRDVLRSSARVLLKAALGRFLGEPSGLVDMIVMNVPSPSAAALGKVSRCYTGQTSSPVAKSMIACDPSGPLVIHVTKLYPDRPYLLDDHDLPNNVSSSNTNGESSKLPPPVVSTFSAFGRIYSGSVRPGDKVRVLGESYSPEDDEDAATVTVGGVSVPRGRFRTEVSVAKAGNWVLLHGIDATIAKTATVTGMSVGASNGMDEGEEVRIFAPMKFPQAGGESVVKLSVEPLNPAELPKMVEGLRRVSKSYPMVRTRVEESGEHVLFGTGELYLDCVMHDLRHVYSDVEVKVADPVVGFRETVVETSSIKCFAETANKRNKLTMIAEPIDEGLSEQLESGRVKLSSWDNKKVGRYFQSKYDWDLLSARSVWAFGDSPTHGPNILLDDTLPGEVDKSLLNSTKSSIIQGFQWAVREGPLCEEPVRSTKLKLLDVVLSDRPVQRGAGQIIPTARRVVHSSLLTASPRLMEPIYRLQIQCHANIVEDLAPLLSKRRGHVVGDRPVVGSPLYRLEAFLPVMDSFGFETDVRTFTQGRAMVHAVFDHWAVVPGDPLDRSIVLHPLEPSPPKHLARDFLVKTRGRKGLSEDVSLVKFFDEGMRDQL